MKLAGTITNMLVTRRYPASLVHFVTNRCNARCPHCFVDLDGSANEKNSLTLSELDKATRRMGPCLQNVNLTGGEPFLHPDLENIARLYFQNAGVQSIYVTTNGSMPDRIQRFAETLAAEFRDRRIFVSLSLDHFEGRHDEIRQIPGLFGKVIESYQGLQRLSPTVVPNIGITVTEENYPIVCDLYRHIRDTHRVRSFTAGPVRDQGEYRAPADKAAAILQTAVKLNDIIFEDMASGRLAGYDSTSLVGRLLNRKNKITLRYFRKLMASDTFLSPCRAGSLLGVIMPDGTVFPCEMLPEPFGNLRDYDCDFMRLWSNPVAVEARRRIARTKCRCRHECAWTVNILGGWRYQPELLLAALRIIR